MTEQTHKPLPVHGYTEQNTDRVAAVNANKQLEETVLRALDEILSTRSDLDRRWFAIGRTHIEEGFMAINRAIFQPQRISLPGDDSNAA